MPTSSHQVQSGLPVHIFPRARLPLSALQPLYSLSQRVVSWAVLNPVRLTMKVNLSSRTLKVTAVKGRGYKIQVTHSTMAFLLGWKRCLESQMSFSVSCVWAL